MDIKLVYLTENGQNITQNRTDSRVGMFTFHLNQTKIFKYCLTKVYQLGDTKQKNFKTIF